MEHETEPLKPLNDNNNIYVRRIIIIKLSVTMEKKYYRRDVQNNASYNSFFLIFLLESFSIAIIIGNREYTMYVYL